MPEIGTIKIRDYKPFNYKGFNIQNISKRYDEDNPEDNDYIFFDVITPKGNRIENQTFCRGTVISDVKRFVKEAIDYNEYFIASYLELHSLESLGKIKKWM